MNLGRQYENLFDDTIMKFPGSCFWIIHVIVSLLFFILGMRFAFRRAPLPFVAYRILRRVMRK
jgi:hypothetical protein